MLFYNRLSGSNKYLSYLRPPTHTSGKFVSSTNRQWFSVVCSHIDKDIRHQWSQCCELNETQIKHCRFVFFTIISTSIKTILSERDTLMREALFVFLEIDNGILTDQIATLPSIGLKYPSLPMHSP